MLNLLYVALTCYIIGSFPSAYLAGRHLMGVDIRTLGDGNAGTANAWKSLGPLAGTLVFVADVGKGAAAVSIARAVAPGDMGVMVAGTTVIVGHNWPALLHFRGGRGAAPAMGIFAALMPLIVLPLMVISLLSLRFTHSSTAGVALVFVPLPFVAWYFNVPAHVLWFSIGLMVMVGLSHALSGRLWPPEGAGVPGDASPGA